MRPLPLVVPLACAALALGACGDDSGAEAPERLSDDEFAAEASAFCADASEQIIALPLPQRRAEIAADAEARAEILSAAREGVMSLGPPEGRSEELGDYLAELSTDIELLREIRRQADAGTAPGKLPDLDESAGQAALALGLDDCAALANAAARTP